MIDGIITFVESNRTTTIRPHEARSAPNLPRHPDSEGREQRTGFTKVFRWPVPAGQAPQPKVVEVVGSFTGWRQVPLSYDPSSRTWQIILNNIEGNRTHRYVMLVDGKPTYDRTCDGLTAPGSPEEAPWQIDTPKGSRVMLMFAQTK